MAAQHFAAQCLDAAVGPIQAISDLARNMARDGYTPSDEPRITSSREWGAGVIERSLRLTLASAEGVLEPVYAGRTMVTNYDCLDYRPSLIPLLAVRPSPLLCPILVIHGSLDKAVRRPRMTRADEPVSPRARLPPPDRRRDWRRARRAVGRPGWAALCDRHPLGGSRRRDPRLDSTSLLSENLSAMSNWQRDAASENSLVKSHPVLLFLKEKWSTLHSVDDTKPRYISLDPLPYRPYPAPSPSRSRARGLGLRIAIAALAAAWSGGPPLLLLCDGVDGWG